MKERSGFHITKVEHIGSGMGIKYFYWLLIRLTMKYFYL